MTSANDRKNPDSARVLNRGPSMQTYVFPSANGLPSSRPVAAAAARRSGQNGSARETWKTRPPSKNVVGRCYVKSTNWLGRTNFPGESASRREPTELTVTIASAPSDRRASTFAR